MSDPVLRWNASPSSNVEAYTISWTLNGAAAATATVPQSAAADSGGYQADFASANPSVTLSPGNVVGCSIVANDTTDNLQSGVVTPPSVTIPSPPPTAPSAPTNVTLSLS